MRRSALISSYGLWGLLCLGFALFFIDVVQNLDYPNEGGRVMGESLSPHLPFPPLSCSPSPPLPPIVLFGGHVKFPLPEPPSCSPISVSSPPPLPSQEGSGDSSSCSSSSSPPPTTTTKLLLLYLFGNLLFFLYPTIYYITHQEFLPESSDVCFSNLLITSLCILSILLDPPSLLSLSLLQLLVFFVFSFDVSLDCGDWALKWNEEVDTFPLFHHIFSIIGLGVLVSVGLGGGVIVRLLLDYGTIFVFYFRPRSISPAFFWYWGGMFVVFVWLRLLWYPYVMVSVLVELWVSPLFSLEVFAMLCVWFVFAMLYNVQEGWEYVLHFREAWTRRAKILQAISDGHACIGEM